MNNNLTVSFDIGIGSVGWAVVDPDHAKLIEFGSLFLMKPLLLNRPEDLGLLEEHKDEENGVKNNC